MALTPEELVIEIGKDGERVTHLNPNDCYYAHLSLYHLALPYCKAGRVLDAGSGAGYGADYLAAQGARHVWGVDASPVAIEFSKAYFRRANLAFKVADLETLPGYAPGTFDAIFSSNVLEHVPNVARFLTRAVELLKPDGVAFIAVPPIVSAELRALNLANPFHLNIWSPRQWEHALGLFFADVQSYGHLYARPEVPLNFANTPAETVVTEKDFSLEPVQAEAITSGMVTAVFVARKPRQTRPLRWWERLRARPVPTIDFIDDSFTRPPASPAPSQ